MSKAIRSYPHDVRVSVVRRRLAQSVKGLGYWAAVDAARKMGLVKE